MTNKIKVKLLRPLDDMAIGENAEFDPVDAEQLRRFGAVAFIEDEEGPPSKPAKSAKATKA